MWMVDGHYERIAMESTYSNRPMAKRQKLTNVLYIPFVLRHLNKSGIIITTETIIYDAYPNADFI